MLVTYSSLLGSLLEPPNTVSTASLQPEWQRYVEWITVLSQNLMAAANDLRPMQVRPLCHWLKKATDKETSLSRQG